MCSRGTLSGKIDRVNTVEADTFTQQTGDAFLMGDRSWAVVEFLRIGSQESLKEMIEFLEQEGFGIEFTDTDYEFDGSSIRLGQEFVCEEATVGCFYDVKWPDDVIVVGDQDARYEFDGHALLSVNGDEAEFSRVQGGALVSLADLTLKIREFRDDHEALLKALDAITRDDLYHAVAAQRDIVEAMTEDDRILKVVES